MAPNPNMLFIWVVISIISILGPQSLSGNLSIELSELNWQTSSPCLTFVAAATTPKKHDTALETDVCKVNSIKLWLEMIFTC